MINTPVEKVWMPAIITTHVTTEPGLSQGVSHDHAPAACPRAWPPAAGPLWWWWWWVGGGGDKSYKASRRRSSCKDRRVPSQAILSATSPVISREWLLSLSSHVAICACRRWLLTGWPVSVVKGKGLSHGMLLLLLDFCDASAVFFQSFCLTWDLSFLRQRSRDKMLCFLQLWNYNSLALPASWTWLVWSVSISSSWGV